MQVATEITRKAAEDESETEGMMSRHEIDVATWMMSR